MAGTAVPPPPAAGHDLLTLDVAHRQVLVRLPWDPYFNLQHRVRLIRLEKSRWVVGTPALEVCHEDLAAIEMYPLPRGGPFPLELPRDEALIMKYWRWAREVHEAELKRRNESSNLKKGGKDGKDGKNEKGP